MESTLFVERRLRDRSGEIEHEVVIEIHFPVRSETDWKCSFWVDSPGTGFKKGQDAYGVDGFQALINAIEGSRQIVCSHFPSASWLSEDEGDIGIPIIVPQYVPYPVFERLRGKIEETVNSFLAEPKPGI